jgi:transcription antitermination factor NusG
MTEPDKDADGMEGAVAPVQLWYALRVKSNFERAVTTFLSNNGYATYSPTYRELRTWSDRKKVTEVPLFPGYVFAQFDVHRRLPILTTPGVVHVVPPGRLPEAVDEAELNSVRLAAASGLPMGPYPFLQVGQRVVIRKGSMTGLEGVLVRVKESFRLVVSVTLLQRSVAVEIDRDWIRPLG